MDVACLIKNLQNVLSADCGAGASRFFDRISAGAHNLTSELSVEGNGFRLRFSDGSLVGLDEGLGEISGLIEDPGLLWWAGGLCHQKEEGRRLLDEVMSCVKATP